MRVLLFCFLLFFFPLTGGTVALWCCQVEGSLQKWTVSRWGIKGQAAGSYTAPQFKKPIFSNISRCCFSPNLEVRILLSLMLLCTWAKLVMPAAENIMTGGDKLIFFLQLWHSWRAIGNVPMILSKLNGRESSSNPAAEREIEQKQHINQMLGGKQNVLWKIRWVACYSSSWFLCR